MASSDDDNPYAVPASADAPTPLTDLDQFVLGECRDLLRPKEKVRHVVILARTGSMVVFILAFAAGTALSTVITMALGFGVLPPWLIGAVGGMLGAVVMTARTTIYLAAVTRRRIFLIRTRQGALGPKADNLGVDELRWKDVASVDVGGLANNRSLTFKLRDGGRRVYRIAPWSKRVSGNQAFLDAVQTFIRRDADDDPTGGDTAS